MIILKNFSVFKTKEQKSDKSPSHRLSAKIGEDYITVGSAWKKETKGGDIFLSVKLADVYVDHTDNSKSRKAVFLCFEEDLIALHKKAGEDYVNDADVPPQKPTTSPKNDF